MNPRIGWRNYKKETKVTKMKRWKTRSFNLRRVGRKGEIFKVVVSPDVKRDRITWVVYFSSNNRIENG